MRRKKLLGDSKGATALEYAFVATLVSTACIAGMSALGTSSDTGWQNVYAKVKAAIGY